MMTGWTSPTHLAILLVIALLLFGAKRLPEIGRSLGLGMREFKESVTGQGSSDTPELPPAQPTSPADSAETQPSPELL